MIGIIMHFLDWLVLKVAISRMYLRTYNNACIYHLLLFIWTVLIANVNNDDTRHLGHMKWRVSVNESLTLLRCSTMRIFWIIAQFLYYKQLRWMSKVLAFFAHLGYVARSKINYHFLLWFIPNEIKTGIFDCSNMETSVVLMWHILPHYIGTI